jgi:hypothetical protein
MKFSRLRAEQGNTGKNDSRCVRSAVQLWTAKGEQMDKLAAEAMQAKRMGLSYGKWKAMQPQVVIEKPEIPDGWKPCEYCGKGFKPIQGKRFCDVYCRTEAYYKKTRKGKAEK